MTSYSVGLSISGHQHSYQRGTVNGVIYLIVGSKLISNSELTLCGGFEIDLTTRRPAIRSNHRLSFPGWFITGNMPGGFHGAQWCYFDGLVTSMTVGKYLKKIFPKGEDI
ncbi:MAG: hypothetical protein IIB44_03260 [Candidatus Marinimicrobia bacterium]|nr:hypothetical protein [Candidatus Neomarinimicrobiota bacterium]